MHTDANQSANSVSSGALRGAAGPRRGLALPQKLPANAVVRGLEQCKQSSEIGIVGPIYYHGPETN